jgi:hypothetical protein
MLAVRYFAFELFSSEYIYLITTVGFLISFE